MWLYSGLSQCPFEFYISIPLCSLFMYSNASITCTRASKVIHIFRLQKLFSTFCPLHRHNSFAFTEQNAGYFQLNIIICKTNIRFLLTRAVEKGFVNGLPVIFFFFFCLNKITQYATCVNV